MFRGELLVVKAGADPRNLDLGTDLVQFAGQYVVDPYIFHSLDYDHRIMAEASNYVRNQLTRAVLDHREVFKYTTIRQGDRT